MKRLERRGVEVRLGVGVDGIDADGGTVTGELDREQGRHLDCRRYSFASRQVAER